MKLRDKFLTNLRALTFSDFLNQYQICFDQYSNMMSKIQTCKLAGKPVSKRHFYSMRQKSIELEKFGKYFREETIKQDKVTKK